MLTLTLAVGMLGGALAATVQSVTAAAAGSVIDPDAASRATNLALVAASDTASRSLKKAATARAKTIKKKYPTYVVSPRSKPTKKGFDKSGYRTSVAYNKYTKTYFAIRSYLELLEKKGGGTLVFSRGTYRVSNVLYVPSNVTIKLESGARILKTLKTGTSRYVPSKSIFQTVRPSVAKKAQKKKKYRYSGYGGERNISFIGETGSVIDLGGGLLTYAIFAGHNTNLTVKGITFTGGNGGHYIELDASKNVLIAGNVFQNASVSSCQCKEAINIDTPDAVTGGFKQRWSTWDKTPDVNVSVTGNTFRNIDVAVGTHKFSATKSGSTYTPNYHTNIRVTDNVITGVKGKYAIHVEQWKDSLIDGNIISGVAPKNTTAKGILVMGSRNLTISGNMMTELARPLAIRVAKLSGAGAKYGYARNYLTEANFAAWQSNTVAGTSERFARWQLSEDSAVRTRRIAMPCSARCGSTPALGEAQSFTAAATTPTSPADPVEPADPPDDPVDPDVPLPAG